LVALQTRFEAYDAVGECIGNATRNAATRPQEINHPSISSWPIPVSTQHSRIDNLSGSSGNSSESLGKKQHHFGQATAAIRAVSPRASKPQPNAASIDTQEAAKLPC
jgi:hypothetical protein